MNFESLVLRFGCKPYLETDSYNPIGKTYYAESEYYTGDYWFYETSDFIIDIHNFFIKKDYIETEEYDLFAHVYLISSYLLSASGEWLKPYKIIEPNTMFIMDPKKYKDRYLLHGNSQLFMVSLKFKERMLDEYLVRRSHIKKTEIPKVFLETQDNITLAISKIAKEILNCPMKGVSAQLFYAAKAQEWLSITLDAYDQYKASPSLSPSDQEALENVAAYINDHYAFDISQDFLEKIALMSGTKLKTSFKNHYHMTITEFTQRKRMNIAENLLLNTDLEIKNIAKSVGYQSPSRFSTLYKRYKGQYPKDVRKHLKSN